MDDHYPVVTLCAPFYGYLSLFVRQIHDGHALPNSFGSQRHVQELKSYPCLEAVGGGPARRQSVYQKKI